MSNASATTITVNTGLFAAGDIVTIINLGAGVCTITAGTATVTTSGSLALAQNQGGVLRFTSASAAIFFQFATPASGDIEGVTAGTGISGGGTSGTVTITNSMATEITAKGDLIVGTGNATFDNLPVGTNGHILVADSSVSPTGLKWAAPATGSMTLLHTLTLSTSSTTQSSISQAYKNLYIVGKNIGVTSGGDALRVRFAGRTGNYQGTRIEQANITALSASGVDSVANDLSSTNGSAFHFTCFDYTETNSEKMITGQSVGNNTGATCFYNISPFNLQTNIASVTITTVSGTATMNGTVEIYGVN